jgi:Flp pilus assembly protein TadG
VRLLRRETRVRWRNGIVKKARSAARAKSGATAMEFAIIAPIMLLMLMAILELGAIFIADATLRTTTARIARELRTGQIQALGMTKQQFHDHFCAELPSLIHCDSALGLDVESFSSFGDLTFSPELNADGSVNADLSAYSPGTACDVVLVRAYYQWPVQTPVFLSFLVNMADNKHLISAASAFRNEPFTSAVEGC